MASSNLLPGAVTTFLGDQRTIAGMPKRPAPRDALARNVRLLMQLREWDQPALAKAAGVSQKTISNVLNERTSVQLDVVEAIAQAFGLNGWHLIMPNLDRELLSNGTLANLITRFVQASPEGRTLISLMADREASR